MRYEQQIKYVINQIMFQCNSYLKYVNSVGEHIFSDRILEDIIIKSKELEYINNMKVEKAASQCMKVRRSMVR